MNQRLPLRDLWASAALAAVYFITARVGLSLGAVSHVATSVWPPSGISLAALLLLGYRMWPGIAGGALLVNLSLGLPLLATLGIAAGNTAEALCGAYLLQRVVKFRTSLERLDDVLGLLVCAALLSTTVSATVGVSSAWLGGTVSSASFGSAWWTWWVGDALGDLVTAPFLLVWGTPAALRLSRQRMIEATVLLALLVLLCGIVFTGGSPVQPQRYLEPYTVFPLFIWAALRFGQAGVTATTVLASGIALWGTAHGWGSFAHGDPRHSLLLLQTFTGVGALSTLILGAVIAERKTAADALQESEARYRQLVELSPDGIAVHSDGRIVFVNTAGANLLGAASPDVLIGRPILDFIHPEYRTVATERIDQMVHKREVARRIEEKFVRLDGSTVDVEVMAMGLTYRNRAAVQVVVHDVTERKEREEAQRRSEAHFRSLIENGLDLIAVTDHTGMFRYASPSNRRVLGYAPEELVGRNGFEFFHPADAPAIQKIFVEAVQHPGVTPAVEFRFRHKDGSWRFMEAIGNSVVDDAGSLTVVINSHDITDRKLAEQALQEEAQVSQALAYVGRELIAALERPAVLDRLCQVTLEVLGADYNHTLLFDASRNAYRLAAGHGYTAEEWEWLRLLTIPRAAVTGLLSWLGQDEVVQVRMSDVSHPPSRAHAARFGINQALFVALRRGSELIGVHAVYRRACTEFSPQQLRIARGVAQLASLALEHARVVSELEGANRIKSDFVATISHELRTPLNVIMGYTALILDGSFGGLTPEQTESLQRVDSNARELRDLIEATLNLSRLETGRVTLELAPVQLPDLIHDVDRETRDLQEKPRLQFVWSVADDLPLTYTDSMKLKVVLKNLIGNAVKFTTEGTITVAARRAGGGVEISVADTGIGIGPEALPIIFEPFRQADSSSTRDYGGVGLGLYIVRRLLDLLGGTISVDTAVGRGSVFRVWLPLAEEDFRLQSSGGSRY